MISNIEEFDFISVIWILASNDDNNIITYGGIVDRIGLDEYILREIIKKRRELFRLGISDGELEDWKSSMMDGKRLPNWIKNIQNDSDRIQKIKNLNKNDVFRSQFRSKKGSPKSEIQIISWGLDHIDRMRKAELSLRDISAKNWQMWLIFLVGLLNVASIIIQFLYKK